MIAPSPADQAHSSTIGGPCETVVERLTKDGFAEKMIGCGQAFLKAKTSTSSDVENLRCCLPLTSNCIDS